MTDLQRTALKIELYNYLKEQGYKVYDEVYYKTLFETDRNFRADFLCVHEQTGKKFFIEINGRGRHTAVYKQKLKPEQMQNLIRLNGLEATPYEVDLIKVNLAQQNGYVVFQYTYEMLLARVYKNNF